MVVATSAPGKSGGNVLAVAGLVGILGGLALLVYGLMPAKEIMDAVGPVFSGGKPPDDLSARMDAAMGHLKDRFLLDGLGFVALLAGVVCMRQAFAKPKPKPVEQLVQEEVERRLAQQVAPGVPGSVPVPASPRLPPLPARPTHCAACGTVLVAGGRICPRGHPQA